MECWMDVLRGMAIIAIVIHHRLLLMPCEHSKIATFIHTIGNVCTLLFYSLRVWSYHIILRKETFVQKGMNPHLHE